MPAFGKITEMYMKELKSSCIIEVSSEQGDKDSRVKGGEAGSVRAATRRGVLLR